MRAIFRYSLATLVGAFLGAALANHLWVEAVPILGEAAVASRIVQQQRLSAEAEMAGRHVRAAFHALSAAEAETTASEGPVWLADRRSLTYADWTKFPIGHWCLGSPIAWDSERLSEGRRVVEAHARGLAALRLERAKLGDMARRQWGEAQLLYPDWTAEQHRAFAEISAQSSGATATVDFWQRGEAILQRSPAHWLAFLLPSSCLPDEPEIAVLEEMRSELLQDLRTQRSSAQNRGGAG